jgi:hypothetical protein
MPSATATTADEAVASAIARLTVEFAGRSSPPVGPVVVACRRDLAGSPTGALPELVERLARQRLLVHPDAGAR